MLNIRIERTASPKTKPDYSKLGFGKYFTDHMFLMNYSTEKGWHDARIVPYGPIPLDPSAMVFHYAQELFEGLKAYRRADGGIQLFRPDKNIERMNNTCDRLCVPRLNPADALQAIKAVVEVDKDWVPSAEGTYAKGLKLLDEYKASLDSGKGVYNCRTDDLYASFVAVTGENLLGYALGLLEDAQSLPFYKLDNRIYEVQGMVLVLRDFIRTLYELYPEIKAKNNEENLAAAMDCLNRICTYDPLYITSSVNSGELVLSYLLFAKARLEDVRDSIRM